MLGVTCPQYNKLDHRLAVHNAPMLTIPTSATAAVSHFEPPSATARGSALPVG